MNQCRGIGNPVKERNRDERDLSAAVNVCQQAALALAAQWGKDT